MAGVSNCQNRRVSRAGCGTKSHGTGFTLGGSNSPFYTGEFLADAQDLVVVTVNYRVDIFGFPGVPGGPTNLGLRDQRAAVEWVRNNIRNFGGDPNKITISGQSAGGASVDYWGYAYPNDPIVSGIIAHSGNVFSFPLQPAGVPEQNWDTVVHDVGCSTATDIMACMRAADYQDILTAAATIHSGKSTSVLRTVPAFYPIVDDELIFSDYVNLTAVGSYAKIPLFLGNNNYEAGFYKLVSYAMGINTTAEEDAEFILESFTCPVAYQATSRRNHDVPVWIWRYLADWNNTRLYPTSGAYHGVDLHMIFGNSEGVSGLPTVAAQRELTSLMQHAWASFCNDSVNGLNNIGWPSYDPESNSLILLGLDNSPEPQFVSPSDYDAACSTITLGALGTSTPTSMSTTSSAAAATPTGTCNAGTVAPNLSDGYSGLCSFACNHGYCPAECICTSYGTPAPTNWDYPAGYPIAGEDDSFEGLCSFCCANGYCPSTVCTTNPGTFTPTSMSTTSSAAAATPTGSCNGGTVAPNLSDNYSGLCSFACNHGYCPSAQCICTSYGTPAPTNWDYPAGYPIAGEDDSYGGLCSFCCANGYCPSTACTTTSP